MSERSSSNRSLFILFSVIMLDLVGFGIVVPILPFYAEQYGAKASVMGWILTSYSLMQFIFSSFWGRFSDRIGRKPTMLITMAGAATGLVILGSAHSLTMIFAGRIISGIFAANISVASAYVTDVTTEENRTRGMGLIGAAFGVGFLLGPAMGGALSRYGYAVPVFAAAGLTVLNMIYAFFRLEEPRQHRHVTDAADLVTEPSQKSVFHQPAVVKICIVNFVFTLSVTQLESIFAFFMMDRFQFDALHVSYVLALMALVMVMIQGGLIKTLSQKFGEPVLLISGTAITMVAFGLIPSSMTVVTLLLPLSLAALGRGVSQPSMMSLVSKQAHHKTRGAVMGAFQSSASLGRVLGPALAGYLYDYWYPSPFYFAALMMGVVFVLALNL